MHTSQVIDRVNGFHLKQYYPPNPGKVGDPADSLHGDLTDPATDISNSDVSDRADSPAGNISDSDVHNGDVGDPAEESSTSTYAAGFTSSSPATKGGFFPDFFPDEDTFHRQPSPINHLIVENGSICLQPSPTTANQPSNNDKKKQITCKCRRRCNAWKSCPCRRAGQLCSIGCHPGHTCTNCKEVSAKKIDLSKSTSHHPTHFASPWIVVAGVGLYEQHRLILTSPTGWLDDDIIRVFQYQLQLQFPKVGGLQAPALAQKYAMEPQTIEFVQVLNLGGSHWITVSSIGCPQSSVKVYDSMHCGLSSRTKRVIADLVMSKDKVIAVTYPPVQWQSGASDCGIFSLAFATSLCLGQDPAAVSYDQVHMRSVLLACLTSNKITPFPQRVHSRRVNMQKPHTELLPVFCLCRLPDDGGRMVQCDNCDEWYHGTCIQLPSEINIDVSWHCANCV